MLVNTSSIGYFWMQTFYSDITKKL